MPNALGWLGWIAGLSMILLFGIISWYASILLCKFTVVKGVRQRTYSDAVQTVLGTKARHAIAFVQYFNMVMSGLAFIITAATSMENIAQLYCPLAGYECFNQYWVFALIFGALQLCMNFLPDLDSVWWVSMIGAIMSFGYAFIAIGLSSNEIAVNGVVTTGTVGGIPATPASKTFQIANSLGAIVFAYSFSFLLVEIADTIKEDRRGPVWHISRATDLTMLVTTIFYTTVAVLGYLAFGNDVCGDILSCFTHPKWVIIAANVMVVVHMIPAYQVYSQPIYAQADIHVAPKLKRIGGGKWRFRIAFRTVYTLCLTGLAIVLPFFDTIVGLVGAIGFWPAQIAAPLFMYIKVYKPSTTKVIGLQLLNVFCLLVTLMAIVGSVRTIVVNSSTYKAVDDPTT